MSAENLMRILLIGFCQKKNAPVGSKEFANPSWQNPSISILRPGPSDGAENALSELLWTVKCFQEVGGHSTSSLSVFGDEIFFPAFVFSR